MVCVRFSVTMFRLATFLLTSVYHVSGFLNIEELRSINYDVDILSTPVMTGEGTRHSVLLMTSKFGQDYQCSLPERPATSEPTETSSDETDVPSVNKLLEPLRNGPCLIKTKNWWTYELCYGESIKQFHIENGKVEGAVIYLGLYESDFDWNNATTVEHFNKTGQQKYHSQIYSQGSNCDITGLQRHSEVRYYCEEDSADYIYGVEEPETCSYVFTVHTSRVCPFPPLKPPASSKPHTIHCSPLLSKQQYQRYLDIKEKEKQAEEERRKIWLLEQQKNLDAIKTFAAKKQAEADSLKDKEGTEGTAIPSSDRKENKEAGGIAQGEENIADTPEEARTTDVNRQLERSLDLHSSGDEKVENMQDNDAESMDAATRNDLGNGIAEQFKELLNEAEQELQDEAYGQFKEMAYLKLDSTVEQLMKQINDAEQGISRDITKDERAPDPEQEEEENEDIGRDSKASDSAEDGGGMISDDPSASKGDEGDDVEDTESNESRESSEADAESTAKEKHSLEDRKLRVRIRRINTRKLVEANQRAMYKEQELDSEDKAKLENALRERLQKAGLDTEGRKIEVKIITAGFFDDDEDAKDLKMLSPEETLQFQNMIVTLLMGNQEAIQEVERHERLEKNYQFVWSEESSEPLTKEGDDK